VHGARKDGDAAGPKAADDFDQGEREVDRQGDLEIARVAREVVVVVVVAVSGVLMGTRSSRSRVRDRRTVIMIVIVIVVVAMGRRGGFGDRRRAAMLVSAGAVLGIALLAHGLPWWCCR
jgi:hypothetical protein